MHQMAGSATSAQSLETGYRRRLSTNLGHGALGDDQENVLIRVLSDVAWGSVALGQGSGLVALEVWGGGVVNPVGRRSFRDDGKDPPDPNVMCKAPNVSQGPNLGRAVSQPLMICSEGLSGRSVLMPMTPTVIACDGQGACLT